MLSFLRTIVLMKSGKRTGAIEYALVASLIAVMALTALSSIGEVTIVPSNAATSLK